MEEAFAQPRLISFQLQGKNCQATARRAGTADDAASMSARLRRCQRDFANQESARQAAV